MTMVTSIGKSKYNNSFIVKLIIIFVDMERRNEREWSLALI